MTNQTTNSQKNIYLIALAIIIAGVIIAGAIVYTKSPQPAELSQKSGTAQFVSPEDSKGESETGEGAKTEFTITEEEHIRGNPEAPVTIVEFSDFQCPFCQRFHPTVQQILENYPNQVRWVYKHFPLGFHEQAQPAAEASECAAEQEKFWEFADGLFENQPRLGENLYKELAQNLGLNMGQFEECLSSRKYKDHVQADYQEGIATGVRGTPGNFVNGESIPGAVPYETLKAAVERSLANLK